MGILLRSSPEPNEQCMNCFVDFRPLELYYRCTRCDDAMHPRCAVISYSTPRSSRYSGYVYSDVVCVNCGLGDLNEY